MSTEQAVISDLQATGSPDINSDTETYFILTSLTSGSSAVVTATSRLELLFRAHKIPFVAIDVATDQKAKRIWTLRANGKKLPVVVRDGAVIGNLQDLEDWNEYGELKQHLGIKEAKIARTPSVASVASTASKKPSAHPLPATDAVPPATAPAGAMPTALVQAAAQAAALATEKKKSGAFSIASSSASIRSVRSTASKEVGGSNLKESVTQEVDVPAETIVTLPVAAEPVEEVKAVEKVEEPEQVVVPTVVEQQPVVTEAPAVTQETAKPKGKAADKPSTSRTPSVRSVSSVKSTKAPSIKTPSIRTPSIKAPSTKSATRTPSTSSRTKATEKTTVPEKAKPTTTRAPITERAPRTTGRAPPSENKSISRSTSRASSLRTAVPRVSSATEKPSVSEKNLKAPSISARSVKSTSSTSTAKPVPTKDAKKDKKGKSKLDKLERDEGERFCGMACIIS